MTSRNSFFNLLKEDLHRRLWTLILSSLVFFGTFVVAFTMVIQNYVGRYSRASYGYTNAEFIERISNNLCDDFYAFWPWFMVVAIVGAIICGMNGFAYLHSRKQMDFYHSLPVKREMIFSVRLVNGVLIYAVPYLAGLLYTYLLCALYRVMTWDIFFCGLFMFVLHLMGYLIMYLSVILAMMLTGKMVIAFFGICVVNLYAPAVYALGMTLRETFFVTSYGGSLDFETAVATTKWLSPGSFYASLIMKVTESETTKGFWLEILLFVLFTAVLVALNLWLYKKRASEKADTAMAFKVTEPVIRMMISIPVGIMAGLLFYAIQYDYDWGVSVFWLIFGGLLGGFLCHGVMEALYNGDIKKCLSHKIQMAVTMVVAAVVPLAFLFDIFGYDSYLPEKKDIKSMAVISSEMRFGGSYYTKNGWTSLNNYAFENMNVEDFDAMYALAEVLTKDVAQNRKERFFGYSGSYYAERVSASINGYVTEPADIYYADGTLKNNYTDFVVRYTLKDGSEIIREYGYNYYAVLDLLEQIYNNNEYKKVVHPVFSLLESGHKPSYIHCYAPTSGVSVKIERNCTELLEAYAADVLSMSFDDLKDSASIGELTVYFIVNEGVSQYEDSTNCLLYPEMTRTIAYLKEQGYSLTGVQEANHIHTIAIEYGGTINELKRFAGMEVPEEDIYYDEKAVAYEDYEIYYEKYGWYPQTVAAPESYQDVYVEFTDPAEIEEIKKHLVYRNYGSEFGPFPEITSFLSAEVYFELGAETVEENGLIGWTERFRFREGSIPQFVIDRLLEEMGAAGY